MPTDPTNRLKKYQAKMIDLLQAADRLDDEVLSNTRDLISQMRERILARTAEISSQAGTLGQPKWGAFWMPRLTAAYNEVILKLSAQFNQDLSEYTIKAYKNGQDLADDGLKFAHPKHVEEIDGEAPPTIDPDLLKIASSFSADLITKMKDHQIKAVSKEVGLSIGLGEPAQGLINRLAQDIDKGPWKSAGDRAEVIARTEVARVQELGRKARISQQRKNYPGLDMYEQLLVAPILNWPCKQCDQYDGNIYDQHGQPFIVAKGKTYGPAPVLPIHPRCLADDMEMRVLTNEGDDVFRDILSLKGDEGAWSLNPQTLRPCWMSIKRFFTTWHKGKMLHFLGPAIDMLVTLDHEMWVKHNGNKHDKYSETKVKAGWAKVPAEHVTINHLHMHGSGREVSCLSITMVDYEGLIGCCELEENGIILVRRRAKEGQAMRQTTFVGNCRCTMIPWVNHLSPLPDGGETAEKAKEADEAENSKDPRHLDERQRAEVKWEDQLGGGGAWILHCFRGGFKVSQLLIGAFKGMGPDELRGHAIQTAQEMGLGLKDEEVKIIGMSALSGPGEKRAKRAGHKTLGKKFDDLAPDAEASADFEESSESIIYESVQDAKERFEKNFDKKPVGCWLWKGAKDKDGFGAFWYNGGSVRAIRFAWELYGGESLKGHPGLLCHKCQGTKNCVRKSHLYLGNHQTNMDDRMGKTKYKIR